MGGVLPGPKASLDDVLDVIVPKVARAKVCLRGDLIDQLEQLEVDYRKALAEDEGDLSGGRAPQIAEAIHETQTEVDETSVEFVFEAIGQRPWSDLIAAHPPTPDGKKRGEQFDPGTFPFAAVAASCVSHAVTVKGAEALYEKVNFGQWGEMWGACLEANISTTSVPRSAAASVTRRTSAGS